MAGPANIEIVLDAAENLHNAVAALTEKNASTEMLTAISLEQLSEELEKTQSETTIQGIQISAEQVDLEAENEKLQNKLNQQKDKVSTSTLSRNGFISSNSNNKTPEKIEPDNLDHSTTLEFK